MLYVSEQSGLDGRLRGSWSLTRIWVKKAASAVDREGFQRLVAEVGLGQVGLVMGLEVSRLARSSLDWHQLLELCSMTGTLILE